MRRIVATLALVFFVGVPVLQWHCVVACAEDDAPTQTACSHRATTFATSALQDDHDCEHPATPAMLMSSVRPGVHLEAMPTVERVAIYDTSITFTGREPLGTKPPGCSPGTSVVPLRV